MISGMGVPMYKGVGVACRFYLIFIKKNPMKIK